MSHGRRAADALVDSFDQAERDMPTILGTTRLSNDSAFCMTHDCGGTTTPLENAASLLGEDHFAVLF
jgi:hypothetical protein